MSGTLATGTAIPFVQLVAVRAALKLEGLGIHQRINVRKAWAVRLGLKQNAKREAVLAALDAAIATAKANIAPGDLTEI